MIFNAIRSKIADETNLAGWKGIVSYEFRMQVKRPAIWIIPLLLIIFQFSLGKPWLPRNIFAFEKHHYESVIIPVFIAGNASLFLPLAIGVMLADRIPRDKTVNFDELIAAMPVSMIAYIWGKFWGNFLATFLPVFIYYSFFILYVSHEAHNIKIILFLISSITIIMLPGTLMISAFSLACPVFLGVTVYRFLFVCYWFWGNLLRPSYGIPTLSNTMLTPAGAFISQGFFGFNVLDGYFYSVTYLEALESIFVLIGITIAVLFILWILLRWRYLYQ